MFYVYWMNEHHKDWVGDEGFLTYDDAVNFLNERGYNLESGWYRKGPVGWSGKSRALIGRLELYKG